HRLSINDQPPRAKRLEAAFMPGQNGTDDPAQALVTGRARAIACVASHQPLQALRPGRRRHRFSKPSHFA
ncbi:MAG: hypothetical protein KGK18_11900, partial [Burkholderiales bacterium]|nr:hypothetical protein [Burkholderiales bacterium]